MFSTCNHWFQVPLPPVPRAARASKKVESIDESGDDRVVWGFKVSPCNELALTNAIALVLDLVVGMVSDMSKKNR